MKKFEVGQKLFSAGLFGCETEYNVVSVTDTTVTFSHSHVSEDDGLRVEDGEISFDIFNDESGDEYVVIWTYHGEEGRLYADTVEELTITPEQVKAGIDYAVGRWKRLKQFECYENLPDSDSGKQLYLGYRSGWSCAFELIDAMGLKEEYFKAIRVARERGEL